MNLTPEQRAKLEQWLEASEAHHVDDRFGFHVWDGCPFCGAHGAEHGEILSAEMGQDELTALVREVLGLPPGTPPSVLLQERLGRLGQDAT